VNDQPTNQLKEDSWHITFPQTFVVTIIDIYNKFLMVINVGSLV